MPFDVKDMENGLKTVANIPLCAVGEDWMTMVGPKTVTPEDLQAAVDALADPAIKNPRVKLGHLDPRFTPDQMTPDGDIFDGTPVLGRFENLQIGDKGMTLYGDAVGVPEWFATIMPFAYPNRSVEGGWDVKTPTGQEHQFVLTAVALLGDEYPAIETLDDLQILFSKDGPEWAGELKDRYVAASKGGPNVPRAERIAASVSVEDIRRSFFEDFATAESGRWDWWTRAVYVDPNLVIATDFDDNLYACPYTLDGDAVEWGEPAEVFTQYVETESGKIAATKLMATKQPTATFSKAGGSRPKNNDQEVTVPRTIHASVDVPALRSRLGLTAEQLPDDATDEQINEALTSVTPGGGPDTAQTPNSPDAPEPGSPAAGAPTTEEPDANPRPSPDLSASGAQMIDPDMLRQLQSDAAEGRKAREDQVKARRQGVVEKAIKAGKIPPARKDHYLTLMERDEEGTTTMLASLAENVIPVDEGGSQGDPDEAADASSYPEEWLTDAERTRLAAAKQGQTANLRVVPEAQNA